MWENRTMQCKRTARALCGMFNMSTQRYVVIVYTATVLLLLNEALCAKPQRNIQIALPFNILNNKFNFTFPAHPSCIDMPPRSVKRVNEYAWQCKECKYCIKCRRTDNSDKFLFCDQCDRGYHIYCIGLRKIPNGKCLLHITPIEHHLLIHASIQWRSSIF